VTRDLSSRISSRNRNLLIHVLIVFLVLVSIGTSQFRSYGISYDEPAMRMHGIANAKYIADIVAPNLSNRLASNPLYKSVPGFAEVDQNGLTHPVFFELGLIFIEYQFGLTDDKKNLWEFRHLATFIFCSLGLVVFFIFLYWRFRKIYLAYLGVSLVIFSPRIFADMFYNNKDAVFMTTYLVAGALSIIYIVKKNNTFLVTSAMTTGLSVATRQVGIVPAILVWFSILFLFSDATIPSRIKKLLLHSSLTLASTVLFQPYYWGDPIPRLLESFLRATSFPHEGCTLTLGTCLQNSSLPWFYLPLWITVTTPIIFLFTFVFGISRLHLDFFEKKRNQMVMSSFMKIDFLVLALVFLPLLIAVISTTTLYNGWRHFYFIYPFLIYFGVRFFLSSSRIHIQRLQLVVSILVVFTFASTAIWMYTNRPLQNLYFNQLAGVELETKWELDYWCLSNRQALEWILSTDRRKQISIQTTDNSPLYDSDVFLSGDDIGRINFLWYSEGIQGADYVIARQDLNSESRELRSTLNSQGSGFRLVYKKSVGKAEIFSIYAKTS
jgi:hypothetical protein